MYHVIAQGVDERVLQMCIIIIAETTKGKLLTANVTGQLEYGPLNTEACFC